MKPADIKRQLHKYYCLSPSRAALDRAAVLLKMSLGGLRIDNQWGTGGGQRPVTQLVKEVINTGARLHFQSQG